MREIAIRVTAGAVEQVLDRLLPLVPSGVREVPDGAEVKLLIRGDVLPSRRELERAAGRFRGTIVERSVPDDWRERRLLDYEPLVIGGRLVVRPEWAPSGIDPSRPELIEIVLGEGVAFGAGTHPTTRACLELLLDLEPRGPFADLGCGTGVLAILAAKLGWGPVVAVDLQPASVAAAAENARRNEVEVMVREGNVRGLAPVSGGFAANVPPSVHVVLADGLTTSLPDVALLSGFRVAERERVLSGYRAAGLHECVVIERAGWMIALLATPS